MKPSAYYIGLGLLLGSSLLLGLPAQAEDYEELDDRLRRIEAQMPQANGVGMPGLVEDIQRLQQEVRELRGEVERLQYESEQARIRQRDMNLDVEKRLSSLEKGTSVAQPQAPVETGADQPPAPPTANTGEAGTTEGLQPTEQGADQSPAAADSGEPSPAAPAVILNEQDEYLKAFELLKQGSYDESITAFQTFLQNFPKGTYSDNARYWLAETHYVKKEYPAALEHFQTLLAEHPNSSKLPGALLKIGYIQYEQDNNAEARLALERVRNEYSGSNVADLARQRLERMDREGR